MRLFCFGFGYTARYVAQTLRRHDTGRDAWIAGTRRTLRGVGELARQGLVAVPFNLNNPLDDVAGLLGDVSHILVSIPPLPAGDAVLVHHARDLAALPSLKWVGYLSTTGVYGDHGGGWVDEDTPTHAENERSARRVAAEEAWLDLHRKAGVPVHIFRLPGIYGPGRSVVDQLRAGNARRIIKPGQVFSRIHAEDLAQVLIASMHNPNPGRIYNVCDDEPAPSQDLVSYAADLLQLPPPPEEDFAGAEMTDMARSFYDECKRVRNDRMKQELGIALRYPTYREGLKAIAASN